MTTILKAENLEKVYRVGKVDVPALRGVSLDVEEGEFLSVMGPSGCGKSTMLHLLGGLLTPTKGRIVIAGEDMTAASDAKRTDIRRRKIGFVFQRFNLFPTLTAQENVEVTLELKGLRGAQAHKQARELLAQVHLADKCSAYPADLSGGQKQRVALARALITGQKLLLADEPTGNLDSRTSVEIMQILQTLNEEQGLTIVIVTHEHDIAQYAKRALEFRDGKLRRDNMVRDRLVARDVLQTLPTAEEQAAEDAEDNARQEKLAGGDGAG